MTACTKRASSILIFCVDERNWQDTAQQDMLLVLVPLSSPESVFVGCQLLSGTCLDKCQPLDKSHTDYRRRTVSCVTSGAYVPF